MTVTWYQGTKKPLYYTEGKIPQWDKAILFVGDQGMLLAEDKFKDFKRPDPFIPDSPGYFEEWLAACKTGRATGSNFEYASALTIANHLGNVAYRINQKLIKGL